MIILTAVCLLFLEVSEVRIRHLRFGCKIGDHFGILVQGLDQEGGKYSGWRGLLFWMERVAFLYGEGCFSGWRGLLFLDGEGCFLDGEVYFSGWRGRGLLDAEGPKVGIELNLEITKDKDRLQK